MSGEAAKDKKPRLIWPWRTAIILFSILSPIALLALILRGQPLTENDMVPAKALQNSGLIAYLLGPSAVAMSLLPVQCGDAWIRGAIKVMLFVACTVTSLVLMFLFAMYGFARAGHG